MTACLEPNRHALKAKEADLSHRNRARVKSADRALAVVECLREQEQALTFTEIQRLLDYPRASLHGLLATLTDRDWLEYDPATRRYSLGLRAKRTAAPNPSS